MPALSEAASMRVTHRGAEPPRSATSTGTPVMERLRTFVPAALAIFSKERPVKNRMWPKSKTPRRSYWNRPRSTRKRGYQITLRSPNAPAIATLMAEMASGGRVPDYKEEVLRLVNSFDRELYQPETIVADDLYDILLISAPIFDQNGEATFNLSLIGFSTKLTGAAITRYADQLVRVCLDVMRADREPPRRAEVGTG